jgi:hypothetical protein
MIPAFENDNGIRLHPIYKPVFIVYPPRPITGKISL